jgi:hypothetical protein
MYATSSAVPQTGEVATTPNTWELTIATATTTNAAPTVASRVFDIPNANPRLERRANRTGVSSPVLGPVVVIWGCARSLS